MKKPVEKLSIELNKFGAVEVSAKVCGKAVDMQVIPAEGNFTVVCNLLKTHLPNVWSDWYLTDEKLRDEADTELVKLLFNMARNLLEYNKPEPQPEEVN